MNYDRFAKVFENVEVSRAKERNPPVRTAVFIGVRGSVQQHFWGELTWEIASNHLYQTKPSRSGINLTPFGPMVKPLFPRTLVSVGIQIGWAFPSGGAQSVIAHRKKINDEVAAMFALAFYTDLFRLGGSRSISQSFCASVCAGGRSPVHVE